MDPPLINNRDTVIDTLNAIPLVRNQFLSDIRGRVLLPDYIAHCTQAFIHPVPQFTPFQQGILDRVEPQVDEAVRVARLTQRQRDGTVSSSCVRAVFEAASVGALWFMEEAHVNRPVPRHRVPVPGLTSNGPLLTRGQLWTAYFVDNIVRGAAFAGRNYQQLQTRSLVALEALATQTNGCVFTIAVGPDHWCIFSLPANQANQIPAVHTRLEHGVTHGDLLRALIGLLTAIA